MSCSGKMMINDYQEPFGALFFSDHDIGSFHLCKLSTLCGKGTPVIINGWTNKVALF